MTATLNDAGRNAAVDGLLAGLAGQTCHLYGGTVPADASELAGTPIATGTTGTWDAADGDSGAALAAPFTLTGTSAAGDGTVATYFRLLGAAGGVLQGSIGGDLQVNNPVVAEGQTVRCAELTVQMPVGPQASGALSASMPALTGAGAGTLAGTGSGLVTVPRIVVVGAGAAPPAGNWTFNNIPVGWTTLATHDGSVVTPSGWGISDRDSVTDPVVVSITTPVGSSAVRQTWEGVSDGNSPDFLFHTFGMAPRYYVGQIMRLSPTWVWPENIFGCKWSTMIGDGIGAAWSYAGPAYRYYSGAPADADRMTAWVWNDQAGKTSSNWMVVDDPSIDGQYDVNNSMLWQHITPTPVLNGEWFKKEILAEYDYYAAGEGRVRVWINDILVQDSEAQSGTFWPFPVGNAAAQFQAGSTRGGGFVGPTLGSDYYADYASIVLAVAP